MSKLNDIKLQPSENLAKVIGSQPVSRPEAVKAMWAYIKANNLQDQSNKRMINADELLLPIFNGKKQISMFELTKVLGANLK